MNTPARRADDRLESWLRATALPVPPFTPHRSRHHPRATVLLGIGAILVGALVAGLAAGGYLNRPHGPFAPAEIPTAVARAIKAAPGLRYALTVGVDFGDVAAGSPVPDGLEGQTLRTESSGEIDLQRGRFKGTADGGAIPMIMFGGPRSGAVVLADGLYVQTEGGPWERILDPKSPIDHLVDPAWLSTAIERWLAASRIDPAVRTVPCGTETCQVVAVTVPPQTLYDLAAGLMGSAYGTPPSDLGPIDVDLFIDPSGFPVRMETHVTAGPTTTNVTLDLVRLDPAPAITPPIP